MKLYLRFKKWVEQKKVQRILNAFIVVWVAVLVVFLAILSTNDTAFSRVLGLATQTTPKVSTSEILTPTNTPIPTLTEVKIPCGPGQNSGQYVYLETASDCQNYTDCGLNDGSWKLMTKSECNVAQGKTNSGTKIDCVGPDNKTFKTTQKECDDFNAAWGKTQRINQPSGPDWKTAVPYYGSSQNTVSSEPKITCVLSHGTYQLTQSSCDSFKSTDKSYTPPQYYSCTICYPTLGTCSTYTSVYKTKEECDAKQQEINAPYQEDLVNQYNQQVQQYDNQVERCQSDVRYKYSGLLQSCTQYFQYGGSAREACIKIYTDQRQREYDACG